MLSPKRKHNLVLTGASTRQPQPRPRATPSFQRSSEESPPFRSSASHNQRVCCDHKFADHCSERENIFYGWIYRHPNASRVLSTITLATSPLLDSLPSSEITDSIERTLVVDIMNGKSTFGEENVDCMCLGESRSNISCMISLSNVAILMRYLAR